MKTSKEAFEDYINKTALIKKYNARLDMNSSGDMYKDLRVNCRWLAWQAGVKFMMNKEE